MAARKLARAPLPPQQQQQQRLRNGQDEIASTMNFGIESSSDGGSEVTDAVVQLRRQNEFSARGAVTDVQQTRPSQLYQQQQQQQQQQPVRLRRTAYLPNKAPPPPPPPPPQPQIQLTGPHQGPDQQRPSSTIVHQAVYTRSREPATISRLTNPFAPTPRPNSQQVWAGNNGGNLSHRSSGSRQSLNSFGGGGGGGSGNHSGHTLKGRLSNLFRRKSRKPLPQQQQQQQQWAGNQTLWQQQQQQQQQQRQRRHSGGSAPAGAYMNGQGQHQQQLQLASRKNLHTFTYTDAKIYNPNNAVHFAAPLTQTPRLTSPPSTPGVRGMKSPAPPPPLTTSSHVNNAVDDQSVDDQATSSRNPVWWNMRTMGATRSAYSTDVLLVKNAEPAPDYETETTRF